MSCSRIDQALLLAQDERSYKRIVMSCHDCQVSRMRLQRLSLEFAEADANQLPLPRQKYGIDFHGHAKGEILAAIDLVTR
jgi:hypothetical protein